MLRCSTSHLLPPSPSPGVLRCWGSSGRGHDACPGAHCEGGFLTAFMGQWSPLGPPPLLPALLAVFSEPFPRGIRVGGQPKTTPRGWGEQAAGPLAERATPVFRSQRDSPIHSPAPQSKAITLRLAGKHPKPDLKDQSSQERTTMLSASPPQRNPI